MTKFSTVRNKLNELIYMQTVPVRLIINGLMFSLFHARNVADPYPIFGFQENKLL